MWCIIIDTFTDSETAPQDRDCVLRGKGGIEGAPEYVACLDGTIRIEYNDKDALVS